MSNGTKYSSLFSILYNFSTESKKAKLFLSLFGWFDFAASEQMISFMNTGKRRVTDGFVQELKRPDGIVKACEHIKKAIVPSIKNESDLISALSDYFKKTLKLDKTTEDYLSSISNTNIAMLLSCLLYLAVVDTDRLPMEIVTANSEADNSTSFQKAIWFASQQNYFLSHHKGNRFESLNIIERLLPKGYIASQTFDFHFESNNIKLRTLQDICESTDENIAITGEGGIGKTTFLQKVLLTTYGTEDSPQNYNLQNSIPIFIELNRCPQEICSWYDDKYKKTNFITRQIADMIQSTVPEYQNYDDLLNQIEFAFRKIPLDRKKTFLLLLDGFNEVSTGSGLNGEEIRASLSHEISELRKLPNIRIITTSRITQSAYYATDFTRVHLKGLEESDIKQHLAQCNFNEPQIEQIISNKKLTKCLSVPLFLCMFSFKNEYESVMPETYGEILSNFFHKEGNYYSLKKRAREVYNSPFEHSPYVPELIVDYIVPYLGWHFVQNDTFSLSRNELFECIKLAINDTKKIVDKVSHVPLEDFDYNIQNIRKSLYSLKTTFKTDIDAIISYINSYLGIIYEYKTHKLANKDSFRYSFVHHYFRDYFSAVWIINTLRLVPYIKNTVITTNLHDCLTKKLWNDNESEVIGQILQEHRNKPIINPNTGNWKMPIPSTNDQQLLTSILEFCREGQSTSFEQGNLLNNIISTFHICRGELSGINLDMLDLTRCNLHNITCSRKGKTKSLTASFRHGQIAESTFSPQGHLDAVMEYVYIDDYCITIDSYKNIKIWHVLSGKLIKEFDNIDECEYEDFSTNGFIQVSPDKSMLAVRIQSINASEKGAYVKILSLTDNVHLDLRLQPKKNQNKVSAFIFSNDSKFLLMICDSADYYSFDLSMIKKTGIINPIIHAKFPDLLPWIRLFSGKNNETFYIVSSDYDESNIDNRYVLDDTLDDSFIESEYEDDTDEEEVEAVNGTQCRIYMGNILSTAITLIHSYNSISNTFPAITYVPDADCFVYCDQDESSIMLYNCEFGDSSTILEPIMEENNNEAPETIHYLRGSKSTCYIMYSYACYQVKINSLGQSHIIEKYNVPLLGNSLNDNSLSELSFSVNVAPAKNRFLLMDSSHETYEWHVENGEPQYKYNTLLYDTVGLIPDNNKDLFMLIHSENGITLFSQNDYKVIGSICFSENDYKVVSCEYAPLIGNMYLLFERGEHYFVRKLDIVTYESSIIFSGFKVSEISSQISVSKTNGNLLITTAQQCYEYVYSDDKYYSVYIAKENETLTSAYYCDEFIHIGIAMARDYLEPKFASRCEIYTNKGNHYSFEYGYIIPKLEQQLFPHFVHKNHDTGIPCCLKPNYLQSYWITTGFFYDDSLPHVKSFLKFKKLIKENNQLVESGFVQFKAFQLIQVQHKKPIDDKRIIGQTYNSYSYLSSDMTEVMCIFDYEVIKHWKNIKEAPEDYVIFDYKKTPELAEGGSTTWDFAIPIKNDFFICCNDSYRLFLVNSTTGQFVKELEYTPGLSICECKFRGSKMSQKTRDLILLNGGKM